MHWLDWISMAVDAGFDPFERVRRRSVRQQVIQRRRQRIQIRARLGAAGANLLQRRVAWREAKHTARCQRLRLPCGGTLRQSKIQQDNCTLRCQLEVLWLDIAVNDLRLLAVQIGQGRQQLIGPIQHLRDRKWRAASAKLRREIEAGNELHHQKLLVALVKEIGHNRQCRVAQARQNECFALERATKLRAPSQRLLDGHRYAQSGVGGFIDCAHAATPDQARDSIARLQHGFWRKKSVCRGHDRLQMSITN